MGKNAMKTDRTQLRRLIENAEEDHRLVDAQLKCLKEVTESLVNLQDEQCEQALEALHRVDHVFRTTVLPHFANEEEGLFRYLGDWLPDGQELIDDLEKEHVKLREQVESFGGQLAVLRYADQGASAPLLFALTRTCWEIWHLFRTHADKENQAIGRCASKLLQSMAPPETVSPSQNRGRR